MAKKKVAHSQKERTLSKPGDLVKEVAPTMDPEASEKLERLKSLNEILLKEAVERRQQVNSLVMSKTSLETELTRSNSEMEALSSELTRLELETSVVSAFVGVQMGVEGEAARRKMGELRRMVDGKESVIEKLTENLRESEGVLGYEREASRRVGLERDEIKEKLDLQLQEGKRMTEILAALEERERAIERELGELRDTYNVVIGENGDMKLRIESLTKEKDTIQRSLSESNKLLQEMEEKQSEVLRERKAIEEEKNSDLIRRQGLENDVSRLKEIVVVLEREKVKMCDVIAVLENTCSMGEKRQKEMRRENCLLLEEKKANEETIEGLTADKTAVERDLRDKLEEIVQEKLKAEVVVNENAVLKEAKGGLESEVSALQDQVAELKSVISKMEESSQVEVGKIHSLVSEVGNYRLNLEWVKTERDELKVSLVEEKANALKMKEKIGCLESKIEDSLRDSEKVKADSAVLFSEKVELESQCEMLSKEIASLENAITEWSKESNLMKDRVQKSDAKSSVLLNMLKGTAAFCLEDEDDVGPSDWVSNFEETKAYAAELEMIKSAFKNKTSKINNMKWQLELLQVSVEDAHKKKSFWTVLSSATALLAAVSLAFVARRH